MKKIKELISIIIPSFNEKLGIKNTLEQLIKSLEKNNIYYEILVVDDNSSDGTIKIVKDISKKNRKVKIMVRMKNPGFGNSLIDGSKNSLGEIVVWVMGDISDDFETIPQMIEKIHEGFDIVLGSRNMKGGSRGDQNKLKAFGSRQFSRLTKFLFKIPIYEITNAFRAFKKDVIFKVNLENNNFAISPEFVIKSHIKGYKLGEVPTVYKERKIGEAKTKLFSMGFFYYKMVFRYWFKNLFGRRLCPE